jgi:hypothetical protein
MTTQGKTRRDETRQGKRTQHNTRRIKTRRIYGMDERVHDKARLQSTRQKKTRHEPLFRVESLVVRGLGRHEKDQTRPDNMIEEEEYKIEEQ